MVRLSDATKFIALMIVLAASFVVAVAGMCLQIAWVGQPTGREGGWVGDISAAVYTAAMIATFAFAAAKQGPRAQPENPRSTAKAPTLPPTHPPSVRR